MFEWMARCLGMANHARFSSFEKIFPLFVSIHDTQSSITISICFSLTNAIVILKGWVNLLKMADHAGLSFFACKFPFSYRKHATESFYQHACMYYRNVATVMFRLICICPENGLSCRHFFILLEICYVGSVSLVKDKFQGFGVVQSRCDIAKNRPKS